MTSPEADETAKCSEHSEAWPDEMLVYEPVSDRIGFNVVNVDSVISYAEVVLARDLESLAIEVAKKARLDICEKYPTCKKCTSFRVPMTTKWRPVSSDFQISQRASCAQFHNDRNSARCDDGKLLVRRGSELFSAAKLVCSHEGYFSVTGPATTPHGKNLSDRDIPLSYESEW